MNVVIISNLLRIVNKNRFSSKRTALGRLKIKRLEGYKSSNLQSFVELSRQKL